jgi:hypothetical protein
MTALKSITPNHKEKNWQSGRASCHLCDDLPKLKQQQQQQRVMTMKLKK